MTNLKPNNWVKAIALALTLTKITFLSYGQTLTADKTVSGSVYNGDNGKPLAGVVVTVKGLTGGTTTNKAGEFTISVPNNSQNKLQFSSNGLQTYEVDLGQFNKIEVNLGGTVSTGIRRMAETPGLKFRNSLGEGENDPLYVVDGKEMTSEKAQSIKPDDIEVIHVLKDQSAKEKYGEKGKNGVVEIELKN